MGKILPPRESIERVFSAARDLAGDISGFMSIPKSLALKNRLSPPPTTYTPLSIEKLHNNKRLKEHLYNKLLSSQI
jgi:hypothetical protein